jgi:hypothetical protein
MLLATVVSAMKNIRPMRRRLPARGKRRRKAATRKPKNPDDEYVKCVRDRFRKLVEKNRILKQLKITAKSTFDRSVMDLLLGGPWAARKEEEILKILKKIYPNRTEYYRINYLAISSNAISITLAGLAKNIHAKYNEGDQTRDL